jgi:hypothetical protein
MQWPQLGPTAPSYGCFANGFRILNILQYFATHLHNCTDSALPLFSNITIFALLNFYNIFTSQIL